MNTSYNRKYRPPFPTLTVWLVNGDDKLGPFSGLLDTGADASFVPINILEKIGALEGGKTRARTHFGDTQIVRLYLVGFQINEVILGGLYVVGDTIGNEIILGRDVLNKLPIFLDGVQLQTEVLDDASVNRLRNRRKRP